MSNFITTVNPTPFGFFDPDPAFQLEADSMVTFVKRKLGDDVLSVELTKREIWTCFEESVLEYGSLINAYKLQSELANLLGLPSVFTGSVVNGVFVASSSITTTYPRRTLEFLMRQAEPYGEYAGLGGVNDSYMCNFKINDGQQDYNLYKDLLMGTGPNAGKHFFDCFPSGSVQQGKLRVLEVFHFNPIAAQQMLLNASNITNFLATEFNYESYVNSTVFYVLPVFEDVLRRGMLDMANRVRRSNYYYKIIGPNLRIFPTPALGPVDVNQFWVRVAPAIDPTNPDINDSSLNGISNPSQVPFTNVQFGAVNDMGRQWIRQYCLALSKELLGTIRSKMKVIPIPGADLELNGAELIAQAREDKAKLHDELKVLLESLTYANLLSQEADKADAINRQLKYIPMIAGKAIMIG